jgi:hypothetical protein
MLSLLSDEGKGSAKLISPFDARRQLGKHVPAATNICNNKWELLHASFSMRSKTVSLSVCLVTLANNSAKTFSRQQRIVGGVVFYAVLVSTESMNFLFVLKQCWRLQNECNIHSAVCWTSKLRRTSIFWHLHVLTFAFEEFVKKTTINAHTVVVMCFRSSVLLSVYVYKCNNSRTAEWNFKKYQLLQFRSNLWVSFKFVYKVWFRLKSDKCIIHFTR